MSGGGVERGLKLCARKKGMAVGCVSSVEV